MTKTVRIINGRRIVTAGTPVQPVRTATSCESLWDAFTAAEQETLATHSNAKVQVLLRTLQIKNSIPLAKAQTVLNALESAGIIAAGRAAAIYASIS